MLYFVNRTKFYADGTHQSTETFEYNGDKLGAEAKILTTVANDMKDSKVIKSVTVMYDENGNYYPSKVFDRSQYTTEVLEEVTAEE